jgi:cell division protein YceG involved in septum cleavage
VGYYRVVKQVLQKLGLWNYRPSEPFLWFCGTFLGLSIFFFALPYFAVQTAIVEPTLPPFPVSVNPATRTIVPFDDFSVGGTPLLAALALGAADGTQSLAAAIMSTKLYQDYATYGSPVAVVLTPGMRREQVVALLNRELEWSEEQRGIFVDLATAWGEGEGRFHPSAYVFHASTTPAEAFDIIKARFDSRVSARYATSTEALVPMDDALTIASIIEREAGSTGEMRLISGILWNRQFADMRLQMDSTLQYARGTARNGWWPVPRSKDKFIQSEFNTYLNKGLPPAPIASPSVAAIVAALNPEQTECMYFFHSKRVLYCSKTYEEHVAKLKKIYGRGR